MCYGDSAVMASKASRSMLRGQAAVRTKGSSKCADHTQKDVIFACNTCEQLICATCSISSHKPHDIVELSTITEQKKHSLQEFITEKEERKLVNIKQEILFAQQQLTQNGSQFQDLVAKLRKQAEKCKEEIDIVTAEFVSLCDKMESENRDSVQSHIKTLEDQYQGLTEQITECKNNLQTGSAELIYDVVAEINGNDSENPKMPTLQMAKFYASVDINKQIKTAVGTLDTSNDNTVATASLEARFTPIDHTVAVHNTRAIPRHTAARPKLSVDQISAYKLLKRPTVISKFLFGYSILAIRPTPNGQAWISYYNPGIEVDLMDSTGHTLQKLSHDGQVAGISLSPSGHLWFCSEWKQTIYELPLASKQPVIKFEVSDNPEALCVTRTGNVVVGTASLQKNMTVYAASGKVFHRAALREKGATSPAEITECPVTGNIAILSGTNIGVNMDRYYMIVYDQKLNVKFHYRGEGRQSVEPFQPNSIEYDSRGNIILSDYSQGTLELINGAGQFVRTLHTTDSEQGHFGIQAGDIIWTEIVMRGKEVRLLKYYQD